MKTSAKLLAVAGVVAATGVAGISLGSYAAESGTATITVEIGQTLALTIDGESHVDSTVSMANNATNETIVHTINVATNNPYGYKLTLIDQDADNSLKRDDSHSIPAITGNSLDANTASWGYKVKTPSAADYETNYHAVPASGSSAATLHSNDGTNITASTFNENTLVKYGIATGNSIAGSYTDTVVYQATGNPAPSA